MKRFEYKYLREEWLDSKEILNAWGDDGWEVCSVLEIPGDNSNREYLLKKQIVT